MNILAFISTHPDYFSLIAFGIILFIILMIKRKNVELQKIIFPLLYLIMYKTKWGLKKMDSIANKLKKHRNALTYTSVSIGFLGMILMLALFLISVYRYFFVEKEAVVAPLLPGAAIPGLPQLSFIHWILAIFVLATVHEFAHGIYARMYNIKVKSSGFAFFGILLPIIPAAFVEPDEKQMEKESKKAQLAVLSAGTFSNFIFAGIFFLIMFLVTAPILMQVASEQNTVYIDSTIEDGPFEMAGVEKGERITIFNGEQVNNLTHFINLINKTSPFETVDLETNEDSYRVVIREHPDTENQPYIGASLTTCILMDSTYCEENTTKTLIWIYTLIYWLFLTNLMVGLVNLLPIGIVDGGQMFFLTLTGIIKNETVAKKIFQVISIALLLLLLFFLIPALLGYFMAPFS